MKVLLVTAMYPTPENPAYGSFIRTQVESLQRAAVDVELLVMSGRRRKLAYLSGIARVRERVAQNGIDLVHAHYSFAGVVARMQWKRPLVVTYHGDDLLGTVGPSGKKTSWSGAVIALGKLLARYADAAIVQSAEMASKVARANVHVVPHEIDFGVFHPVEKKHARELLGLHANKKYLLFAANPQIAVKRFPLAQAVAEQLAQHDSSVELLVVSKETQQRLALFMSACDALVFPSYQEGSPNVVKQAMACNLPIVATDVGDVRQVIGDTKNCYVCGSSVSEFAICLAEILKACPRTNGREQVRHLDSSSVAARVIHVYEQVLNQRKTRAANRADAHLLSAPRSSRD